MSAAKRPPARSKGKDALAKFHEEGDVSGYDVTYLKRLWPFVRPQRHLLAISVGLLLAISGLALVRPWIMGRGLDAIGQRPGAIVESRR
jgi:hypothetical protein